MMNNKKKTQNVTTKQKFLSLSVHDPLLKDNMNSIKVLKIHSKTQKNTAVSVLDNLLRKKRIYS